MSEKGRSAEGVFEQLHLRYDILACLAEAEREKAELETVLDSSRATIYRGVRELEETGLVEYGTDGYRPTVSGKTLLNAYEDFIALVDRTLDAQDVLNILPDAPAIPPAFLRDVEVISAENAAPHIPGSRLNTLISETNTLRGLLKTHSQPGAKETYYQSIIERGMEAEVILQTDFYEYLRSLEDAQINEILAHDRFEWYTVERVPYGLLLPERETGDRCVVMLAYDSDLMLRGILINESPAAIEWGNDVFQRYKQQATALESPLNDDN
ncbi:MAG: helix-turn-helix transcriptional regulator [Halobacteriales archaeon]